MASTVYYLMTIFFLFTIVNGAAIKSDLKNINNLVPEKCRELLLNANRDKGRNYCTETWDSYPEEIQKEIEDRVGNMSAINMPMRRNTSALKNDDCTSENAKQNCCTKSGWEEPSSLILNDEWAFIVQLKHFYQQIKVVECAKEGTKCFGDLGFLETLNYVTECKTDYAYQKVYVYSKKRKTLKSEYISTPVSCSCVISRHRTDQKDIVDNEKENESIDFSMEDEVTRHLTNINK